MLYSAVFWCGGTAHPQAALQCQPQSTFWTCFNYKCSEGTHSEGCQDCMTWIMVTMEKYSPKSIILQISILSEAFWALRDHSGLWLGVFPRAEMSLCTRFPEVLAIIHWQVLERIKYLTTTYYKQKIYFKHSRRKVLAIRLTPVSVCVCLCEWFNPYICVHMGVRVYALIAVSVFVCTCVYNLI